MCKQKVIFAVFIKEANFFHAPPSVHYYNRPKNTFIFIFGGRDLYQTKGGCLRFKLIYNLPLDMLLSRHKRTSNISIGFSHFQAFHISGR